MAIYEYECDAGHITDRLARTFANRLDSTLCDRCGKTATVIEISRGHVPPSGVYSYEPNIGNPRIFEQRLENRKRMKEATKDGKRTRSFKLHDD